MMKDLTAVAAEFDAKTPLLPHVVADTVLAEHIGELSEVDRAWFRRHVYNRTLVLYEASPVWRADMEASGDRGRDVLYTFVRHWLDAFLKDKGEYRKQYAHMEPLNPCPDEGELTAEEFGGCDTDALDGLWLESEDGELYILPTDTLGSHDEVIGPDDQTADRLMEVWCRFSDPHSIPEDRLEELGLTRVADALKRWSPQDGYYHA